MINRTWKLFFFAGVLILFMFAAPVGAKKFQDLEIPDNITVEQTELFLQGVGMRVKYNIIDVYAGALYLQGASNPLDASRTAKDILDSDEAIAIRMYIETGMLTQKKLVTALEGGLKKSTQGNPEQFEDETEKLVSQGLEQKEEVEKSDVVDFVYIPEKGLQLIINSEHVTTVKCGVDFKKAFFGIWLSENPVQKNLKEAMLGN